MAGRKSVWKTKIFKNLDKVTKWRSLKYTNEKIAEALTISEKTFYKYLLEKPELREALELGEKHIEQQVKNKLIDLCLGGVKKEKKVATITGYDSKGKPIIKEQKIEIEETLPSLGAIKYYLDKRDGSYNTFNNNNDSKEELTIDHTIKGSKEEKEALSIRLQNIVEGMDKETKD